MNKELKSISNKIFHQLNNKYGISLDISAEIFNLITVINKLRFALLYEPENIYFKKINFNDFLNDIKKLIKEYDLDILLKYDHIGRVFVYNKEYSNLIKSIFKDESNDENIGKLLGFECAGDLNIKNDKIIIYNIQLCDQNENCSSFYTEVCNSESDGILNSIKNKSDKFNNLLKNLNTNFYIEYSRNINISGQYIRKIILEKNYKEILQYKYDIANEYIQLLEYGRQNESKLNNALYNSKNISDIKDLYNVLYFISETYNYLLPMIKSYKTIDLDILHNFLIFLENYQWENKIN